MKSGYRIAMTLAATGVLFTSTVFAQDSSSGWKPVGGTSGQAPALQQNGPVQAGQAVDAPPQAVPAAPATLNLKSGTYVTVRVNQSLSSDKNQTGDTFTATLVRPLVVDGFVVAAANQTFGGKVAEAIKAGKAQGVSHLGLQLTDLMFVDGQHSPIQSELVALSGPATMGNNRTTVNAAGSTPGVLLTHGKATVIGPESVLTFKIDSDVSIATSNAPQAFRPVGPSDYNQPNLRAGYAPAGPYGPYGVYPYYPYAYYYGYPYYPYYWGPGVGVYFGGVWGGGFGFRGRFR